MVFSASREGLQWKALREERAQPWNEKPDSRKPKRERKRKRGLRVARPRIGACVVRESVAMNVLMNGEVLGVR